MSRTFLILGIVLIVVGGIASFASHKAEAPAAPFTTQSATTPVDPSWETYSDDSVSFRYPAALPTTYIHSVNWPPKVTVSEGAPECTEPTTINGHQYCVTTSSEGAAGSIYIDYAYATEKESKTITLSFTLREVQCGNYDDPQKTACEQERKSFDVDAFADNIAQTVTLK